MQGASESRSEANHRPPEREVYFLVVPGFAVEVEQPIPREDVEVDPAVAPRKLVAEDVFDLPRTGLRTGTERGHVAEERPQEVLPYLESEAPAEVRIGPLPGPVNIGRLLNDAHVEL